MSSIKRLVLVIAVFIYSVLLLAAPAVAQSTKTVDAEKSVLTDEVYYLIPVQDETEEKEEKSDDGSDKASATTQSGSRKGDSSVSSIESSQLMAPPGGGGGGSSGPDPLHETYERQNIREDLTPYGADLLGEQFDLATGSLTFNHTDVVLPGNTGLEVAIRRTVNTAQGRATPDNEFADWELDVPKMEMMVSSQVSGWWQNDRCSERSDPGPVFWFGTTYESFEYWNGLKMHIPGQGAQTVLDNPTVPVKSVSGTKKSTTQYWDISCTNIGGGSSEGFKATSPEGITYTFEKLRYLSATPVSKNNKLMGRKRAQMLATKVEDRFGNFVNYNYSTGPLTEITSSDGRSISIEYGTNGKINRVVANGREWTYSYDDTPTGYGWDFLETVTLPSEQSWTIDISDLILAELSSYNGLRMVCPQYARETATGSITHPYGAKGTYTIAETSHGRTGVPNITNLSNPPCSESKQIQRSFDVLSLTQKKLEGNGMPTYTWNYIYSENQGGWAGGSTSPLKTTRVNKPDGSYDIQHFDRSWTYLEGALVKHESFSNTGSLLQKVEYDHEAGPIRGYYGEIFYENLAKNLSPKHQNEVKTTRGSDIFMTEYDFDTVKTSSTFSFGKPIQIDQSNSFSNYSLVLDIAYAHDLPNWEIGRETTRKVGTETLSEYHYDGYNRVQYVDSFGVQVNEFSYNTDGTVAWQKDALGNQTTFANWHRGIPELIIYADSTTHEFDVDNNGWIQESTDARGFLTQYEYDNMGRLEEVDYPDETTLTRASKTLALDKVNVTNDGVANSGIAIGQWKHTGTRGELQIVTYLDSLFRPVLTRTLDTTNNNIDRFTRTAFDSNSQPVFQSFPSATAIASTGTNSVYDALGRVKEVEENVTPFAKTTYTYLNGNKVTVTNPRNKATTTTFFALGSPDQSSPTLIQQPANVTTTVVRNYFGEMTSATQAGTSPTVSATRNYYYDSSHRLCRQVEPETGSTVYAFDDNGDLNWYALAASGSTTSCDHDNVPSAERVDHTVDEMRRLRIVNYPDSSPDLVYSYDDNGNLETLNSTSANWTYDYNAVNALIEEELVTNSQTFNLHYGFDNMDRLTSITYPAPTSQVVSITPNAYGEAESVGSYASNVDYHVNGSISQLNYGTQQGTGRVYSTTQNAQQLPENLTVMLGATTLADFAHVYDPNANIIAIDDGVNGTSFDRTMDYDDLDRLTDSAGSWGTGSYDFDALGNILSKIEIGSLPEDLDLDYSYNGTTNRLTSINDSIGSADYSFAYDAYGNVTANGSSAFVFDLAGNMTSSTNPAISYKYDGHKRRVQKTEGGQTSYSVYSQSGKLMHKKKGGVSTDYVYAGSFLVAEKSGSTVDYMHTDLLGSPIAGNSGSSYQEHYRPWGEKKDNPIQLADDVGYTGHQSDIATGLTYMQARYYDPVVGRFMAVDPVQFKGGSPANFGRYTYVANNPVNAIDPDGEATQTLQVNADIVILWGVGVSVGVFFNPGTAPGEKLDFGIVGSVRGAVGGDVSATISTNTIDGSADNLVGVSKYSSESYGYVLEASFTEGETIQNPIGEPDQNFTAVESKEFGAGVGIAPIGAQNGFELSGKVGIDEIKALVDFVKDKISPSENLSQ